MGLQGVGDADQCLCVNVRPRPIGTPEPPTLDLISRNAPRSCALHPWQSNQPQEIQMKRICIGWAVVVLACTAGSAWAQGRAGEGAGAAPAASAPGIGPGMHARRGQAGADITPGWSMMTPAERADHRARMGSIRTYDECKAYMDKHREEMASRAKESGKQLPVPRRDGCRRLKP
jgi:hypothetical protein